MLQTRKLTTTFDAANRMLKWIKDSAQQIPDGDRRRAFDEIWTECQKISVETGMDMNPPQIAPASSAWQCVQISMTGTEVNAIGTGGVDGTHILPLDEVHDLEQTCSCGAVQIELGLFVHKSEEHRRGLKLRHGQWDGVSERRGIAGMNFPKN